MTAEMLEKARANCKKGGYKNVEFRLGEIENLPVADNMADVIISNCVINLSTNKQRVFQEAYRVLKPKGRLMISDIVLLGDIPDKVKSNVLAYVGCIAGAEKKDEYIKKIKQAGFQQLQILDETHLPEVMFDQPDAKEIIGKMNLTKKEISEIANDVVSVKISAVKP